MFVIQLISGFFKALGLRACRFEPSCSHYALSAFDRFSWVSALQMTLRRLGRCHPFHEGGYDPLPSKSDLRA